MVDASAREYVLQSGEAHTKRISDGSNPSSLQMAEIMYPVRYSDKSRFRNTEVVCMLQIADSGAFEVSEVNVRALSLNFSRAVSLSKSLTYLGQSRFDTGSHVATSKPLHSMRNLLLSQPAMYSTSYFFFVAPISL